MLHSCGKGLRAAGGAENDAASTKARERLQRHAMLCLHRAGCMYSASGDAAAAQREAMTALCCWPQKHWKQLCDGRLRMVCASPALVLQYKLCVSGLNRNESCGTFLLCLVVDGVHSEHSAGIHKPITTSTPLQVKHVALVIPAHSVRFVQVGHLKPPLGVEYRQQQVVILLKQQLQLLWHLRCWVHRSHSSRPDVPGWRTET